MDGGIRNIQLDTRLLSDAIVEMSISRRNVSIYPREHPIVDQSLSRAFVIIQKIFELRDEITLAIAKDTLIIDSCYLDKKNPVFREFAQSLSRINIASVTFIRGLTKDELYSFNYFITTKVQDRSSQKIMDLFEEARLPHFRIEVIDFSAFHMADDRVSQGVRDESLWEEYICGLLDGDLVTDEMGHMFEEISSKKLAMIVNEKASDDSKKESYDRFITSYIRKSSGSSFSGWELTKLTDFIHLLRPELKQNFLSSAVSTMSTDLNSVEKSLKEMGVDDVISLLSLINEQVETIPEALKNILDKFSMVHQEDFSGSHFQGGIIEDDIFLSPEVSSMLNESDFKSFVSDTYQAEIQQLLNFDRHENNSKWLEEIKMECRKECSDEAIEKDFNHIILEVLSCDLEDILGQEDYEVFIKTLSEQMEQFIGVGQYKQVLKMLKALESNIAENKCVVVAFGCLDYFNSTVFLTLLVKSYRHMYKEVKEDIIELCGYYGEKIIRPLLDELIHEESLSVRKNLITLITGFGDRATPIVINYLNNSNWYVTRNILYILNECGCAAAHDKIRPFLSHENDKVSLEALKCLLRAGDSYAVRFLSENLGSDSREVVKKAIALCGTFKVTELVPDLIMLLEKKAVRGRDFENKIPVVKALGLIGDPRAHGPLRKILSSRSLFFRKSLGNLKNETDKTIKQFFSERTGPAEDDEPVQRDKKSNMNGVNT